MASKYSPLRSNSFRAEVVRAVTMGQTQRRFLGLAEAASEGAPEEEMFRTARSIDSTLRSLLAGVTMAAGLTVAGGAIVGCGGDENDPLTHVKRLSDASTRVPAVSRLIQFFEDAMTKDNKDRKGPNVQPVLDKIVEPLSQVCVAGDLDEKTQTKVVKFLSDARDARGAPCLIKTLKDYKPDGTEEDVRIAARGVAAMKAKDGAGPLFDAFSKLRASKPKAAAIYRDINEAVVEMSDPSWEAQCITMTAKPIADKKDMNTYNDESFWQLTCAQILGNLKSEKAVPNLIKIMLSPLKAQAQSTAVNALIKIGKPAITPTLSLLKGENNDLMEYSKLENMKVSAGPDGKVPDAAQKEAAKSYFLPAAVILGSIGREDAVAPMIEAIGKTDDAGKVIIARELLKMPISAASLKAVQEVYEKASLTLTIPPGMNGRGALLEQFGYTFDSSLVPWVVKDTLAQKGSDEDLEEVRGNAYVLALKLAKPENLEDVDKLGALKATGGSTIGKGYEKEAKAAKDLLKECAAKLDCYMGKLTDPNAHLKDTQFIGIKAAYMVGILGSDAVKPKLIELIPKVSGDAARFVVVQTIDHFSPKGDQAAADKLLGMLKEAEDQKNATKAANYSYFKQFGYRLIARQ